MNSFGRADERLSNYVRRKREEEEKIVFVAGESRAPFFLSLEKRKIFEKTSEWLPPEGLNTS